MLDSPALGLAVDRGLALFAQALGRPEAHLAAVQLDLAAVQQALRAALPPLWRTLVGQATGRGKQEPSGTWVAHIAKLPPERREQEVRLAVQADVARVLSLGSSSGVQVDRPFRELGLDSLMAVELRNALAQRLDRTLPATLAFDHPTIAALTDWLLKEFDERPYNGWHRR